MAYSVKSAGVAVKKIALSYSLYNVFDLLSKTALTILNPLFASLLEKSIQKQNSDLFHFCIAIYMLTWIISSALSLFYLPVFHDFFKKYVGTYEKNPSVLTLIHGLLKQTNISVFVRIYKKVSFKNVAQKLLKEKILPSKVYWMNTLAYALNSISLPACLLAAHATPEYRVTALTLAPLISGWATLILFLYVDPFIALESEKTSQGAVSLKSFRGTLAQLAYTKVIGAVLGLFLVLPVSKFIVFLSVSLNS